MRNSGLVRVYSRVSAGMCQRGIVFHEPQVVKVGDVWLDNHCGVNHQHPKWPSSRDL